MLQELEIKNSRRKQTEKFHSYKNNGTNIQKNSNSCRRDLLGKTVV